MSKELDKRFNLVNIQTEQFAIIKGNFDPKKRSGLSIGLNVRVSDHNRIIAITLNPTFGGDEKPSVILEVTTQFKVEDNDWDSMVDKSGTLVIPKGFLIHLAVICVGIVRGVLHTKTEKSEIGPIILPTINVSELFGDDLRMKVSE